MRYVVVSVVKGEAGNFNNKSMRNSMLNHLNFLRILLLNLHLKPII